MGSLLRVPVMPLAPGPLVLQEATGRYVTRVHRLGAGDRFVAFDPESRTEADVVIVSVSREVACDVTDLRDATAVARHDVTLLQAMGKGDKPEQVVRDATALGASRLVLLYSARSVPREKGSALGKQRRLRTIAVEAARQSGRGDVPEILGPVGFEDALAVPVAGLRVCLDPSAAEALVGVLERWRPPEPLTLLVGPEGGFDDAEREAARARGFVSATFGDFVLRTETAAIAVLGAVTALAAARR